MFIKCALMRGPNKTALYREFTSNEMLSLANPMSKKRYPHESKQIVEGDRWPKTIPRPSYFRREASAFRFAQPKKAPVRRSNGCRMYGATTKRDRISSVDPNC